MNMPQNGSIVLGVTDGDGYEGALQFAVDEALRRHCGITVVHALPESLAPPPDALMAFGNQSQRNHHFVDRSSAPEGYELVTAVARRAREMGRERIDVDTSTPPGPPVHVVIEAAVEAQLIVLQHRNLPALENIFRPSTSVRVASRSLCPVVIVTSPWDPKVRYNRVTVGLEDIADSTDVLGVAFETARSRGARIEVLHAGGYLAGKQEPLDQTFGPWRQNYPDVTVELNSVDAGLAEALLERSRTSDLLLVGRYQAALPLPLPLGSLPRALVNGSSCPVLIVPRGAVTTAGRPTEEPLPKERTSHHV